MRGAPLEVLLSLTKDKVDKHELTKDKVSRKGPGVDPINDNGNARGKPLNLVFPSQGFGRHGIWS